MLRNLLLIIIILSPFSGHAHDVPLTFDRIHLNATASAEVVNDTLVAVLFSQREGKDAAELSNEVNDAVAWALGKTKAATQIDVQTLGYQTQPIYRDRRLDGWRVRQSLRLESREPDRLAKLLGTLQERLAVESVGYAISPARLREAEESLMVEALGLFHARAELVRTKLGAAGFRMVEVSVDGAGGPPPMPRAALAMEMRSAAATPPTLEPGTRDVSVTVRGTIELERR